jgi:DNA (cytosine-5)-methyltransferase 1
MGSLESSLVTGERLVVMDLFCGTGGFTKGFENTGLYDVVFGIDLLPDAVDTFRLNHPDALGVRGDIRAYQPGLAGDELGLAPGEVDVIVGGPPCQGFSSIRPNRSSADDDHRNSLFEEFASYVEHFRPRAFVMENVVGLATHKRGETLEAIDDAFDVLRYDTDWRILNAAHFGVPQKRERLVMIGLERGASVSFPRPTHGDGRPLDTIGHRDRSRMLVPSPPSLLEQGDVLSPYVTVDDAIDDLPEVAAGEIAECYDRPPRTDYQAARRKDLRELAHHESTRHTARMLEIVRHAGKNISSIPPHLITSGFSSCYSRVDGDEPCVTLTVNFIHPASNRCIHPRQHRALTVREGARIQSFDDDFQFVSTSRNRIAKLIGNAVPPLLGRTLGLHVAQLLGVGDSAAPEWRAA